VAQSIIVPEPDPALIDELRTANADIAHQIRGLSTLANTSASAGLSEALQKAITVRDQRRRLISSVLANFDAVKKLNDDGYPDFMPVTLTKEQHDELILKIEDVGTVGGVFDIAPLVTSTIEVNLGEPEDKPAA
jgi:hypothetical protein